jgi:hypothetical protein
MICFSPLSGRDSRPYFPVLSLSAVNLYKQRVRYTRKNVTPIASQVG